MKTKAARGGWIMQPGQHGGSRDISVDQWAYLMTRLAGHAIQYKPKLFCDRPLLTKTAAWGIPQPAADETLTSRT